jgi:hypothetical protein
MERLNRELEGLSTLDMSKRFMAITKLMLKTRKLSKQEVFMQHNNIIFVNMDKLTPQGLPTIDLAFSKTRFKTPYCLNVVAVKNNENHVLAGLKIG